MPTMTRRSLTGLGAFLASGAGSQATMPGLRAMPRRPRVLLRSSWQSVNIGDVGHTPGALSIFARYFPEAEITLWPGKLEHGSRELLLREYPHLTIAEGGLDAQGRPNTPALANAWEEADLYLSGSGSGFPASEHALAFLRATAKPVGVFGVSADPVSGTGPGRAPEGGTLRQIRKRALQLPSSHLSASLRFIVDRCAFFFCRDTISRDYLKAQGARTPVLEFGPDAQLGMHVRNDARALAYLRAQGLEEKKFICVVPRLRYTPYYRVYNRPRLPDDDIKDAINERTTAQDHAKLRAMMVSFVQATGNRVLVCPEMTYQVELGKEVLVDPLPEAVRRHVVWRDTFWLPDEAASVYARAQAVVSIECHSPLIAYRNGTPAFYVRQPTDTCKGQMYRDFGAGDWLFEVDETSGEHLWKRLKEVVDQPARAEAAVASLMVRVEKLQSRMAAVAREVCETRAQRFTGIG